jgi:acetyl-CoA carboxylase biotin carboxyl carrier protein
MSGDFLPDDPSGDVSGDPSGDGSVDPTAIDELRRQATALMCAARGPLKSVRVRAGDLSVEVEWPEATVDGAAPRATVSEPQPVAAQGDAGTTFVITAPLVGTFYRAPAPGARPFVEVGDEVQAGQQVAIVEAMKLMNAVEADRPGRVVEVLVQEPAPVEYGEPLFVLTPPEAATT